MDSSVARNVWLALPGCPLAKQVHLLVHLCIFSWIQLILYSRHSFSLLAKSNSRSLSVSSEVLSKKKETIWACFFEWKAWWHVVFPVFRYCQRYSYKIRNVEFHFLFLCASILKCGSRTFNVCISCVWTLYFYPTLFANPISAFGVAFCHLAFGSDFMPCMENINPGWRDDDAKWGCGPGSGAWGEWEMCFHFLFQAPRCSPSFI